MLHTQTPTVVHVLSLRPVDPNKNPLNPSIQGLKAATPRLVPTLVEVVQPPTSMPEAAYLLDSFLYLLPAEQHHQPTPLIALILDLYIFNSLALAMVSPTLHAYLGIVMKYDLKPHPYVSCKNQFPYNIFVYLFIH